ncbi:hypothetical protein Hanom_Chr04g00307081 [Helianthus anomalus]
MVAGYGSIGSCSYSGDCSDLFLVPFGVEGRTVIFMIRRPMTANDQVPGSCLALFPAM